ncbi:MAG: hypothetical protein Q7S52_06000 [bacterium]|nr:hypothetical protein [bacterium]
MTYETDMVQKRIDRLFAEKPWLAMYFEKSHVRSVGVGRVDKGLLKEQTTHNYPIVTTDGHRFYRTDARNNHSRIYLFASNDELVAAVGEKGGMLPKTQWERFCSRFDSYPSSQSLWERMLQLGKEERERIDAIVVFYFNDSGLTFHKPPHNSTIAELFEQCRGEQGEEVAKILGDREAMARAHEEPNVPRPRGPLTDGPVERP